MSRWGVFTSGEDEIKELLKRLLEEKGYRVVYEGVKKGPDLVVSDDKELIVIEIKGIPPKYKVRDKGKLKSDKTISNQYRLWSGRILIELMEREQAIVNEEGEWVKEVFQKLKAGGVAEVNVRYWGVFGKDEKYRKVLEKRKIAIKKLGYEIYFIDERGNLEKII